MHPLLWIQRLFTAKPESDDPDNPDIQIEEESPFSWNQHVRIVLAIVVVIISAMVMWWIVI